MTDYTRLSNGFVNWERQRVFVPWFGAPRLVPSAANESRVLKFRFGLDIVPVLVVVLFFAIAWWIDGFERVVSWTVLALGLGLFGLAMFLEQRWISQWPRYSAAPFSRARFMVRYYRSMQVGDRVWEFGFGVGGLALASQAFGMEFLARLEPWNNWLVAIPSLVAVGLLMFFLSRHTALTLVSLLPIRRRGVEQSSCA